MNFIQGIFKFAGTLISLYTMICFARIIVTWFPRMNYSTIGKILSEICDPYLNIFSKLPLHIGMIDFSPMISIGLLTLTASMLQNIAATGKIYIGGIIADIIGLIWSAALTILGLFLLFILIRLVVYKFIHKGKTVYNSIWSQIDYILNPIISKITAFLTRGKTYQYDKTLLMAALTILVLIVLLNIVGAIILKLVTIIPF